MRLMIMFIMALLTITSAQAQNSGEKREYFKDWLAACRPDTGYCSAISYINPNPGNGSVADHWLRIGRHKDGAKWEISLTPIKSMPSNTTTFYFWIGEDSFWFTKGGSALAHGAVNDIFMTGDDATKMLGAMLAGSNMSGSFDSDQGETVNVEFSLSGLTASMLWIDEQQGRLGDPRIAGDLPIGLELAEPKLTLPTDLPAEIFEIHAKQENCEPPAELVHGDDWQVYQVNNDTLLFMLPCSAGAYNFSYMFYTQSFEYPGISKLLFADYSDSVGWTGTDMLVNPSYEPETKTLYSFYKGRGLGDCGTSGEWQWQDYGFKMLKFYAKSECDGFEDDEEIEFPQIFPALTK